MARAAATDTILKKIPKKERAPFDGWERPRVPVTAKTAAQQVTTGRAAGAAQSSPPAASSDPRGKDKKTPAANQAGQPSTMAPDGNDQAAAAMRGGKGATTTRASVADDGAPGAGTDPDAVPEPTIPSAPD